MVFSLIRIIRFKTKDINNISDNKVVTNKGDVALKEVERGI